MSTFYFRPGTRKTTRGYHVGRIHPSHAESSGSFLRGKNGRYGNLYCVMSSVLIYIFARCAFASLKHKVSYLEIFQSLGRTFSTPGYLRGRSTSRDNKLATRFQEVAQMCLRISKILFFGQVFLCGLETPVLKLQKSETGVSEYVSVVEASSTSSPSSPPTQVRGNCRKSSPSYPPSKGKRVLRS